MGYGLQGAYAASALQQLLTQRRLEAMKQEQMAREQAQQQFQNNRLTQNDQIAQQLTARELFTQNAMAPEGTTPMPDAVDIPGVGGSPAVPGVGENPMTGDLRMAPARFTPREGGAVPALGVGPIRLRPRSAGDISQARDDETARGLQELSAQEEIRARNKAPARIPTRLIQTPRGQEIVEDVPGQTFPLAPERSSSAGGLMGGGGDAEIPGLPPTVTGMAVLDYLPRGEAATVKKLLDYQIELPRGMALRTPEWRRILAAAAMADPTFDAMQYPVRQKVREDFTSKKASTQLLGLNTAVGHINSLVKAAAALGNSKYPVANWVENKLSYFAPVTTGLEQRQGHITGIDTKFNAITGELASIFKQSGATDQEINAWRETLQGSAATATPQMWDGFVDGALELMGSRLRAQRQKYTAGTGLEADFRMLSDESRKILGDLGLNMDEFDPGEKPPPFLRGTGTEDREEPEIGDEKTFPNGARGRWDGTGWIRIGS